MDGHELRNLLDVHDALRRINNDPRFPNINHSYGSTRHFALAWTWVLGFEHHPRDKWWPRVLELLGIPHDDRANWRIQRLIADDAPRYEPDDAPRTCEAPMVRRDGPCGRNRNYGFKLTNPADGTWRIASYCARHADVASRVRAEERRRVAAGGIPEPLPNRGGLLPSYIGWDWPDRYRIARPSWTPPKVGICADDWPVMARVIDHEPPSLTVLTGDATAVGNPREGDPPTLKLIRGNP